MFVEIFKAIIFGIVQGITEWLPVSSTGHMILLNELIHLDVSENFYRIFEVVIQLGSVIAVVVLFFNKLFPFKIEDKTLVVKRSTLKLWLKIIVACLPGAIIGVFFDDFFEELFYNYTSVSIVLIVVGVAFIVVEHLKKNSKPTVNRLSEITLNLALIIGAFQVIAAIFPGASRSGMTIIGALIFGVARPVAAEFTFMMAVPVMLGASLLRIIKIGFNFTVAEGIILLVGMITAFVVSMFVIKALMRFVRKHDFRIFGYYRIALGVIVLILFTFVL